MTLDLIDEAQKLPAQSQEELAAAVRFVAPIWISSQNQGIRRFYPMEWTSLNRRVKGADFLALVGAPFMK